MRPALPIFDDCHTWVLEPAEETPSPSSHASCYFRDWPLGSRTSSASATPQDDLTGRIEAAMAGMEQARADFEAASLLVGAELAALQDRVRAAHNLLFSVSVQIIRGRGAQRRRLSGQQAGHLPLPPPRTPTPGRRAGRARVRGPRDRRGGAVAVGPPWHECTTRSSGSGAGDVDAAERRPAARRRATAREAWNECCSALVQLVGRYDVGDRNHVVLLSKLSVQWWCSCGGRVV